MKGADTVSRESRGYDASNHAGPGITARRKQFIVIGTLGLLLVVMVCSAARQDRDGAKSILLDLYLRTRPRYVFADGGCASCVVVFPTS